MVNITYKVTLTSGDTYEVETTFDAWCAWEDKFNRSRVDPSYTLKLRDHAWVIWRSCMGRDIVVPLNFDDYLKKIAAIDVVQERKARPTKPAPTAG